MNCRAQKWILHVTGKLRLCIFSNTQLFILALKPDIFSLLECCAFPSRERYPQKPSWLSCTFPLGMVPVSPSCGRWSSPLASPPAPFLHPHQSCGENKKAQTTLNPSPFCFFPFRARMLSDGLAASIHRRCVLMGFGRPCCSLAQCSGPSALIVEFVSLEGKLKLILFQPSTRAPANLILCNLATHFYTQSTQGSNKAGTQHHSEKSRSLDKSKNDAPNFFFSFLIIKSASFYHLTVAHSLAWQIEKQLLGLVGIFLKIMLNDFYIIKVTLKPFSAF